MSNDRFLDQVNRELRTMAREDERLAQQHEAEVKRRAVIRSRTAELMKVRTVYLEMMGLAPQETDSGQLVGAAPEEQTAAPATPPPTVNHEPETMPPAALANGSTQTLPTTADLAESLMKANGGKIKIREILDEAIRIGKLRGKESDYGSVFGALKGNPKRFVKIGPGEFALVGSDAAAQAESADAEPQAAAFSA